MENKDKIFLNIGAGQTYIPGFKNIDISSQAEITLDLGKEKLPFDDNSVDLIFSYHTLEHVPDYLFALSEIYRVLKDGGVLLLGLPYVSLTKYHLVNPYHLHNFNEFSFDFFDASKLYGSAAEETPVYFKKVFHRFHYMGAFHLIPPPFRSWCRNHLFNVVKKIDYGLVAVKSKENKAVFNSGEMIREFDAHKNARIPYGQEKLIQQQSLRAFIRKIYYWWIGDD